VEKTTHEQLEREKRPVQTIPNHLGPSFTFFKCDIDIFGRWPYSNDIEEVLAVLQG